MDKTLFDKYFVFSKEEEQLYLKTNIDIEIEDSDVYTYVQKNFDACMVSLCIGKNISNIANFHMRNHYFYNINVDKDNNCFLFKNGCLSTADLKDLYYCVFPYDKKQFTIPNGTKRLMPYCFFFECFYYEEKELKIRDIFFNEELEEIKEHAFSGSYNGINVHINKNLKQIKQNSFECDGLKFKNEGNENFSNKNGLIMFKDVLLDADYSHIATNLPFILNACPTNLWHIILNSIPRDFKAMRNTSYNNQSNEIDKYLSEHDNFIISNGTLLAYYGDDEFLKIPEGVKKIYSECQGTEVARKVFLPSSLEEIENRTFVNNNEIVEKPSWVFRDIEEFVVDSRNKRFYANKYFLYDIANKKIVRTTKMNYDTIYLNDPMINELSEKFIPYYAKLEAIVFDNSFPIRVHGSIAQSLAIIKKIIFKSTKVEFDSILFNKIQGLEFILVDDLNFAKKLYSTISASHRNKIYCSNNSLSSSKNIEYEGTKYYPLKERKILKTTNEKMEKVIEHIQVTPNFSRYTIAKILECTPASALKIIKDLNKQGSLSDDLLEEETTRAHAYSILQDEEIVVEHLKIQSFNFWELVKILDPSEKRKYYYRDIILGLINMGRIHRSLEKDSLHVLSLVKDTSQYNEKMKNCKESIIKLFDKYPRIATLGIPHIEGFDGDVISHVINEMVVEGKILKQYKGPWEMYNYVYYTFKKDCVQPDKQEDYHNVISETEYKKEISKQKKTIELNNQVYYIREIMKNLYEKKTDKDVLIKLLDIQEDQRKTFNGYLLELEMQKAIDIKYENVLDYSQPLKVMIVRKKTYEQWDKEISFIKKHVLDSVSTMDFVSQEYLLQFASNRSVFFAAINELLSENQIIESRKLNAYGYILSK